jgi:hypothetical protein
VKVEGTELGKTFERAKDEVGFPVLVLGKKLAQAILEDMSNTVESQKVQFAHKRWRQIFHSNAPCMPACAEEVFCKAVPLYAEA